MSITSTHPEMGVARANKVFVNTTYSSDGRNLEGFWLDYDPTDKNGRYALFLLERMLNSAPGVERYSVYNAEGARDKVFNAELYPKRV
jgi:hypothetical protein